MKRREAEMSAPLTAEQKLTSKLLEKSPSRDAVDAIIDLYSKRD